MLIDALQWLKVQFQWVCDFTSKIDKNLASETVRLAFLSFITDFMVTKYEDAIGLNYFPSTFHQNFLLLHFRALLSHSYLHIVLWLQWGFQPSVNDVTYLIHHKTGLSPPEAPPPQSFTPKQVHKYDHRKGTGKSEYRYHV